MYSKNGYTIRGEDLKSVLSDFRILVDRNQVEKIGYGHWRNLVTASNSNEVTFRIIEEETASSTYIPVMLFTNELPPKGTLVFTPKVFIDLLFNYVNKTFNKEKERNNKDMNMSAMKSMEFGPVNNNIAISPYGLAVCDKSGNWYTYNVATSQVVEVTGFTFDFKGMIFKMPVAIPDIAPGDMIIHQGKPMYVVKRNDTNIEAVDILNSEAKNIIPITNMFGFNFVTKIVSLVNLGGANPSPDQPFGNLMPVMMASMVFGEDNDSAFGDMDMSKLMMLSMMTGGSNPFGSIFNFGNLGRNT